MKALKKLTRISSSTLFAWMLAGAVSAQTTTPTVPNTGASDITMNLVLLVLSGLVVLAGIFYLTRPSKSQQS